MPFRDKQSAQYLATLIDRMRQTGVRVIIADPESPMALLHRISGATGARVALWCLPSAPTPRPPTTSRSSR